MDGMSMFILPFDKRCMCIYVHTLYCQAFLMIHESWNIYIFNCLFVLLKKYMLCLIFANYLFFVFRSSKHRGIWMIPEYQDIKKDQDSGLPSVTNMEKTDPRT